MREKFARFMQGRYGAYGTDALNQFVIKAGLVLVILNLFLRKAIISWLVLAILAYSYFRLFSKNYQKRYAENQQFLTMKTRFLYKFSKQKSELAQRKTHHIYKCPSCKQKIRVPRGKGNIIVTCPKCRTEFQKRS